MRLKIVQKTQRWLQHSPRPESSGISPRTSICGTRLSMYLRCSEWMMICGWIAAIRTSRFVGGH